MARLRVFVSSTFYDLKHIRGALDLFIDSLGYDSILSEKGDIAYTPERALDESCYREVGNADIFVVIIGGRYGSPSSGTEPSEASKGRYDSITRKELEVALERQIPTYILVDKGVYGEFTTYQRNKDRDVRYAHVDSVEIFKTIENILSQPKNNPVHTFERFEEISRWLKEQWGGYFRELIHRGSTDKKIADLAEQVSRLSELNVTLKRYLERLVTSEVPDGGPASAPSGTELVKSESERLAKLDLRANPFYRYMLNSGASAEEVEEILASASSIEDIGQRFEKATIGKKNSVIPQGVTPFRDVLKIRAAIADLNAARKLVGKPEFPLPPE